MESTPTLFRVKTKIDTEVGQIMRQVQAAFWPIAIQLTRPQGMTDKIYEWHTALSLNRRLRQLIPRTTLLRWIGEKKLIPMGIGKRQFYRPKAKEDCARGGFAGNKRPNQL